MSKVCLVIDGNNTAHRAYHAFQSSGLTDADGNPTWAVHGFFRIVATTMTKVLQRYGRVDYVCVAFDDPEGSVRKQTFAGYKATRPEKDSDTITQIDECLLLSGLVGLPTWIIRGREADDVVASVAKACERDGIRCVISTNDRDALGLISDSVSVYKAGPKGTDIWIGPAELQESYGVAAGVVTNQPSETESDLVGIPQYTCLAAMRGDTSDNIDGVKGIGPAKASKMLAAFGSVEGALADFPALEKAVGKAGAASLRDNYNIYARNVRLMMPILDAPDLDPALNLAYVNAENVRNLLLARGLENSARALYNALQAAK